MPARKSCRYLQKNLSLFTVLPLNSANSNKSVEKICHRFYKSATDLINLPPI
ncbi:unnamed protein product [Arabidopsis halleri]